MKSNQLLSLKTEKEPLGMRYFEYTYHIRCLLLAILNGFVALVAAYMSWYFFSDDRVLVGFSRLVVAITCLIMMVLSVIIIVQYKKWQENKALAPALYAMTQTFVWLGGITWVVFVTGYTIESLLRDFITYGPGERMARMVLYAVILLFPTILRSRYFSRRKKVYKQSAKKNETASENIVGQKSAYEQTTNDIFEISQKEKENISDD